MSSPGRSMPPCKNRPPVAGPEAEDAPVCTAREAGLGADTDPVTASCKGRVHSIETCGTVDGPGIRFVVFLQGCPMRCLYCHNPDTWDARGGTLMSADEVLAEYEKSRQYYEHGGLTVTGGEPLLQMGFLTALCTEAKRRGIHVCLDTSGICFDEKNERFMMQMDKLAKVLDLVLLDIKHMDETAHLALTGHSNSGILAFARYLERRHIPVWIRHVLVEGYTLEEKELAALGAFIRTLSNVQAVDLLPYHSMGKEKYKALGRPYPLAEARDVTQEQVQWAKELIWQAVKGKP